MSSEYFLPLLEKIMTVSSQVLMFNNGCFSDIENRLVGEGEGGMIWEKSIYITIDKTDSQWEFEVWRREPKPVFCDSLERWGGEGGDTCVPMAGSRWCMAATITILLSNYPLTKKNFF